MKWQELSGEERYRVVEMTRKGEVPVTEICKTFGVSRQTLYRAMDKADAAAVVALEPQKPGRKKKSEDQLASEMAKEEAKQLAQELAMWKTKYEISSTYLELERKYDRGEPLPGETQASPSTKRGKKTRRNRKRRTAAKKR